MAKKKLQEADAEIEGMSIAEVLAGERTPEELRADRLADIARQQVQTSVKYKEKRMQEIAKNEDLYYGRTKKALKGRWNVPLPLMPGYIDTLLSKIDDPPRAKYGHQDPADVERAMKTQAAWDAESTKVENMWALKDRFEKKLAALSGVGISKTFAFNDENGQYVSSYEAVDHLDFECEPMGGQILKNHLFKGQRNIFKTEDQLKSSAKGPKAVYNKRQVLRLIFNTGRREQKEFQQLYQEKTERLRALGFNPEMHSYVGINIYNLTEWYMQDPQNGEKYYLLFEPHSGIWVRACPLKEVFESDTDPFEAWHTHVDPFNFWSKAPADDERPIAEAMNVIFNQSLDARDRKIYGQRAYDPEVFPDPSQLEWRPDGLVEAQVGISKMNGGIGGGIYQFKIDGVEEAQSIDLMKFMDEMTGLKTGITAGAQGATDDKRVGIYFGNLQQVADRLGLYNKSYSEAWGRKALKFYWGLQEHASSGYMVKLIGENGYNWTELTKEDLNPTRQFNITIVGGQAEAAQDELLKKTRADSLTSLLMNPNTAGRLNPDVTIEAVLSNGGWEEGQIKRFLDTQPAGSELVVGRAHQAIQEILDGKKPSLFRGATVLFMQTIVDFATDSGDLDLATFQALLQYAQMHQPVVIENTVRKARTAASIMAAKAAMAAPVAPGSNAPPPGVPGSPAPDAPVSEVPLTPTAVPPASPALPG